MLFEFDLSFKDLLKQVEHNQGEVQDETFWRLTELFAKVEIIEIWHNISIVYASNLNTNIINIDFYV